MPPRKPETILAIKNRTEKVCSSCKMKKPVSCFGKDRGPLDGLYSHCKECRKIRTRLDYEKRKEKILTYCKQYRKTERGKETRKKELAHYKTTPNYKAGYLLTNAVRDGRIIKPKTCSKCSVGGKIHGHHYNYTKPLEVVWVCKDCHQWIHKHEKHLIIYS